MLKSMTGYGYGESTGYGRKFTVELRAVNHRFCEVALRAPRFLLALEKQSKSLIQSRVARGRVDCFLSVEKSAESAVPAVKVDKALAGAYYKAMVELGEELGIDGKIKLKHITVFPGVLDLEEDLENAAELWPLVKEALEAALTGLVDMRAAEGEKLSLDLRKRTEQLKAYTAAIKSRAPQVAAENKERLSGRLQGLLAEGSLEPARVAAEAALFAERSDITEETVRLDSHISQLTACFDLTEAVGRKLDFLAQEINREINTIGSKANDLEVSRLVIELKSELEKIKEQVQNIE